MFISTVRTRHILEVPDSQMIDDLGFLTNRHLLNTAMTRSKWYVAVVGDPVALCTVGDCSAIWKKYINVCGLLGSIHPCYDEVIQEILITESEISQHEIHTESVGMDNDMADESSSYHGDRLSLAIEEQDPLETDEILRQLSIQASTIQPEQIKMSQSTHSDKPLKVGYSISIKKRAGHAVPVYKSWSAIVAPKRKLLGADDYDKQYDSDDSSDDLSNLGDVGKIQRQSSEEEMKCLMESSPLIYKRCVLQIASPSMIRAKVICPRDGIHEIAISSRRRCGRAFNNDEVCVEVKEADKEDATFTSEVTNKEGEVMLPQGVVIGVLKRTMNPCNRRFVCTVEATNTSMMIPLSIGFPRMNNVSSGNHLERKPKGSVCVYSFTVNKEVRFLRYENVTRDDGSRQLFLVRFLKWEQNFRNPLGIIIGVLEMGETMEDGLAVLDIEHFVAGNFKQVINQVVDALPESLGADRSDRVDLRHLSTFTVDPPQSKDLDDALSIEQMKSGDFRVGVHIADVSHFVLKDSLLDKEAKSRCTTFYPVGKDPVPMLPERLSNHLCSLQPSEDRKTLSLFMWLSKTYAITKTEVCRSTINSKWRLTYAEAELIIDGGKKERSVSADLLKSLKILNAIAENWRKARLGDEANFHGLDKGDEDSPKAHLMVQELMITTNMHIAHTLLSVYPDCVPLRSQMPPDELLLQAWRQNFAEVAQSTFVLKRPFMPEGRLCRCMGDCTCVSTTDYAVCDKDVCINVEIWNRAFECLKSAVNPSSVFNIANPHILPEATNAQGALYDVQERAAYTCSGDYPEQHHTLQAEAYTHFTSPIRRYIDLVIHRMLVAQLNDDPCPYTQEEISDICRKCTDTNQRAKNYEKATESLQLAVLLQQAPVTLHSIVDAFNTTFLQVK